MGYPKIEYNGKDLFQVACRKCESADHWKIYTDKTVFVAECECGYRIELKGNNLKREPDTKAIPLHKLL